MTRRKKLYYPPDQITSNPFTKGEEFMTEHDRKNYVGFYHKYVTGEIFTEKEWDSENSVNLIPYKEKSQSTNTYDIMRLYHKFRDGSLKKIKGETDFSEYEAPRYELTIPSREDYNNRYFYRYFITKRNDIDWGPMEIGKEQYDSFQSAYSGINQYLFKRHRVLWKLTGPEYDMVKDGIIITPGVINTNLRIIESLEIYGINKLIDNPRKFTSWDLR